MPQTSHREKPEPKPNPLHAFLEGVYGRIFRVVAWAGLPPKIIVTLEVAGRRSGKPRSTVLVLADYLGEQYAVSVVGERSDWVQNLRSAGGVAVVHHGKRRLVQMIEVPVEERASVLKRYVKWALGARAVMHLGPGSDLAEFEKIAGNHPVFRITPAPTNR